MKLALISIFFLLPIRLFAFPDGYKELGALEKQEAIWKMIVETEYDSLPTKGPSAFEMLKILSTRFLSKTFTHKGDEFPIGRKKLIHTYGTVAKVLFIPAIGHPYTGLFAEQTPGLIRFSLALDDRKNYTPGIALKLFSNALTNDSPSLVAMDSVDGQGRDYNFFKKDFFTEINPTKRVAIRPLEDSFKKTMRKLMASHPAFRVPVDDFSKINISGKTVSSPYSPVVLKFSATRETQGLISSSTREEVRDELSRKLSPGTTIYNVYGGRGRKSSKWALIGELKVVEDYPTSSEYGDEILFFRHQLNRVD